MKRGAVTAFGIVVVVAAIGLAATVGAVRSWLNAPIDGLVASRVIVVASGQPLPSIARRLAREGLVSMPRAWAGYARIRGLAGKVKAGEYLVEPGTTPAGLLEQLVAGRVLLHSVTIPEGLTFAQALKLLQSHPAVDVGLGHATAEEIMQRLGKAGVAAEGRLFPDTYRFARGASDLDLLRQAHARLEQELAAAWQRRAPGLPLRTADEALVLASLVEKETGVPDERPLIAGVFVNRLRAGMRLQTDPSVIYGIGPRFDGNLRRGDLQRDTPWNTYTRAGLPPTPIALVGAASLEAAVHPAETDARYFVATGLGDGRHYFAATLPEHNRNVARYLAAIRAQGREGR